MNGFAAAADVKRSAPEVSAGASLYAWYVLAMLMVVYIFNWFDRYLLNITMESIKNDLGLSDTELGIISGFAFSAVYSISGLFIARMSDLGVRRTVVAGGLALWSTMTAVCGMASGFVHLVFARFGVGIGEATCSPPSHSLISDYFPPRQRATAIAVFSIGLYIGLGLGLGVGGWLNEQYGWRHAFMAAAVPGLLFAVLFRLTVKEPPRGAHDGAAADQHQSIAEVVRFMVTRRSFVAYTIGTGLFVFAGDATDIWGATFLMRVHGYSSEFVGARLGLLGGVAGALGTLFFAVLADRLSLRDLRWYVRVAGLGGLATMPFILLFLFASKGSMLFAFYFFATFCGASYMAPTIAVTQRLMPPRMRAVSSAVILLSFNIIGVASGNLVTGLLSDAFTPQYGDAALRYALAWTMIASLIGFALMIYAARRLPRDIEAGVAAHAG
ncbi:spinster family MFS transporter [Solimonas marina]|uniref:MFS transporter n=1 Tax=Solimonas marina TaxID=2714601 RepID=A0A969WCN1_9GAMM|nr:MFS transporter [Solimonas marina]NKF23568.1 MFS transporter [Solimonas marina]